MRATRRLILAAVLAVALGLASGAAPAHAQGDTVAVAINTKDGSSLWKFAFQVRRTMSDVVDQANAAVAISSCNDCQTVAISFQVLLAGGDASVATPTNLALAMNIDCTACVTAAFAYQFVISGDVVLHFTPEGNRRIAALRKRLHDLRKQDLTLEQLNAELVAAANELRDILNNELVAIGPPDRAAPDAGAAETPTPEPTATPPPEASPAPTPTPTPSPEPTATATP
jgi:putative peptide zinc metalloprotease protein